MADSPELQQAREKVAELERRQELTMRIADFERELAAARDELGSIGRPPVSIPSVQIPKP